MPIYEYICPHCQVKKEIFRKMKDSSNTEMCQCGILMDRIYTIPNIIMDASQPKTIGALADKNTEKMIKEGKYRSSDLSETKRKEKKEKQKKMSKLGQMTPRQKQRYIETGKM